MSLIKNFGTLPKRIARYALRRWQSLFYYCKLYCDSKFHKCVYIFGSPEHSNLGDNAQTLCINELVRKEYPEYKIRFFTDEFIGRTKFKIVERIRRFCRRDAVIMLHSGYHLTDLYMLEENLNRAVVKTFHDFPILALPQTIHYRSRTIQDESAKIYNSHPRLHIMCRDRISYETAKELFPKCQLSLMPDVVTMKIGCYTYNEQRKGILLCKRSDAESNISLNALDRLVSELAKIDTIDIADTTVPDSWQRINRDLKGYLEDVWKKYASYKVVVTDRYHGTIFSLIANTPVVVLASTDHKLSSGVDWFPDEFRDYIYFTPSASAVAENVRQIYASAPNRKLPPYFLDKYFQSMFARAGFKQ